MLLIGDAHGLFMDYRMIVKSWAMVGIKKSLQLGDFGLGFPSTRINSQSFIEGIEGDHKFIRGNHDDPDFCRKDKNYAGDFGIIEGSYIDDYFHKLFFISGARSIDSDWRTPGLDWWPDEQLSDEELCDAVNLYNEEKPAIVCSHDCPTIVLQQLYPHRTLPTRTSQAMDIMFMSYKPSYWIFGHHHMSWRKNIDGCWFICLNELETLDISKRIINIEGE